MNPQKIPSLATGIDIQFYVTQQKPRRFSTRTLPSEKLPDGRCGPSCFFSVAQKRRGRKAQANLNRGPGALPKESTPCTRDALTGVTGCQGSLTSITYVESTANDPQRQASPVKSAKLPQAAIFNVLPAAASEETEIPPQFSATASALFSQSPPPSVWPLPHPSLTTQCAWQTQLSDRLELCRPRPLGSAQ